MRILPDYNCIYVHIPKTAGNSISDAIDSLPVSNPYVLPADVTQPKHIKARDLRSIVGETMWESAFTFAFVRNPWDQMVSCYNWWVQKAGDRGHPETSARIAEMGFSRFMASPYGSHQINEFQGNSFDWISDSAGNAIVDYIGRFETLEENWRAICSRLEIDPIALPHLNQTDRVHYREYYTAQTRTQIARRFRRTIETFGYQF